MQPYLCRTDSCFMFQVCAQIVVITVISGLIYKRGSILLCVDPLTSLVGLLKHRTLAADSNVKIAIAL